jgi:cyclopropane-fatty-acyl-phospholipid synthase
VSPPDALGAQSASPEAIQFHYDAGTEFYRLWLDRECVYSCALWQGNGEDLEQAQLAKLDYMLSESGIAAGERLLDVGCGWGGILRRATDRYRVAEAVGLTLAITQADYITSQAQANVRATVEGWQQHEPSAPYDAIISIGAFEHFVRPELDEAGKIETYRAFFQRCADWLAPERRLVLQTITYENASSADVNPFLRDEIFPESELPHLHEIVKASKGLFEITAVRGDRVHYARTLAAWSERLRARREVATALVGSETVQRYERYLKLARLGFLAGNLGLVRITFQKLRHLQGVAYSPSGERGSPAV